MGSSHDSRYWVCKNCFVQLDWETDDIDNHRCSKQNEVIDMPVKRYVNRKDICLGWARVKRQDWLIMKRGETTFRVLRAGLPQYIFEHIDREQFKEEFGISAADYQASYYLLQHLIKNAERVDI